MSGDVHVRFCESRGVRFPPATHLVAMCATREEAEAALRLMAEILGEMGLELKASKTRILHLEEGGEGFDFLGFHHRWVRAHGHRGGRRVMFLARWPSERAMRRARDKLRELTVRNRLWLSDEVIVGEVNAFLRGWTGYFRYGNSARHFEKVHEHALERLILVVAKRHHRTRRYGLSVVAFQSPNQLGLIALDGIVVAPRPYRDWRGRPNADGERRR